MKILMLIIIINFSTSFSQNKLYLGKKQFLTKKSITTSNINKLSFVYKKIYFKKENNAYQPIGFFGKNIESKLDLSHNKINLKFKLYKKYKFYSLINSISGLSFFTIWIYRGVSYNLNTGNDNITQFVFKNKQYFFILPTILSLSGSIYFKIKSTKFLKQSVNLNNKLL